MTPEFMEFIHALRDGFTRPLPGMPAQMRMATMKRIMRDGRVEIPPDARKAGVLVLFYPFEGDIYIPFIKRNEYPGVHSGQVSFPGGGHEEADRDISETALRETEEETGIRRSGITLLGSLTELFIPPSNFVVTPVVGYMDHRPEFMPDPDEVEKVLEVPLDELLKPGAIQEREITVFPGYRLKVPCFYFEGLVIWGATAMMLSELVDMVSPGSGSRG